MNLIRIILSVVLLAMPSQAIAQENALEFLKALSGTFKGQGTATIPATNREERVSCKLENTFNNEKNMLAINGLCATTQGKTDVEGELHITQEGALEGWFFSPSSELEVTKSETEIKDKVLIISTVLVNKKDGSTKQNRQLITLQDGKDSFVSSFESYQSETDDYKEIGSVTFKLRGDK